MSIFYEVEDCPVCGAPGNNCRGDALEPSHIVGVNLFPSLGIEETYYVKHDLFEDRNINDSSKVRVRLARAGSTIPMSEAKRLGLS